MAKKKNLQKKHSFKHTPTPAAASTEIKAAQPTVASVGSAKKPMTQTIASATTVRDFSYVAHDLKRIGIAAVILVTLEMGLFYLLTQTPAGEAIYHLVKV